MFDRTKAIDELIYNDIDTVAHFDGDYYLEAILRNGFKGYINMTNEELIQELNERDISELFGDCDDE